MDSKLLAEEALQQLAHEYVNFEITGKQVKIPYVLGYGRWQFWNSSGKGTPEMIRNELVSKAQYHDFDLHNATTFEIFDFMRTHRIGVDCSGLVYHLLDAYVQALLHKPLSSFLVRYNGNFGKIEKLLLSYKRYRRINAKTLTSPLNTTEVYAVKNIEIGDLIRISRERDHVLLVTKINRDQDGTITNVQYIHSSSVHTQKRGPHYGEIVVLEPEKGLESQNWLETTKQNDNYGKEYFQPERGDSVRRLNITLLH